MVDARVWKFGICFCYNLVGRFCGSFQLLLTLCVGVWQVRELGNPGRIYEQCMGMMARLAELGLVHCDFNEFNLLVSTLPLQHNMYIYIYINMCVYEHKHIDKGSVNIVLLILLFTLQKANPHAKDWAER